MDVRSRSLRSVVFKLSTGLLHASDLLHERDFLAHLLEWFNFEEVAMEGQVLSLISQLTEVRTRSRSLLILHYFNACSIEDIDTWESDEATAHNLVSLPLGL